MIEDLRSYKWPRLKGEGQWIRCFAHILNLIAQAILRPFGSNKRKNTAGASPHEYLDSDNDETDVEPDDPDEQIKLFNEGISGDNNNEDDNEETDDDAPLASNLIGDDEIELEHDDLNDLSDEGEEDQYTTQSCKESLSKVSCDAQQQSRDLVELLQPFYEITLQVSTAGAARIADIVVFIDQITSHLSSAISDKRDDYPPAIRNACRAGLHITNKYYTLTDCSPLYRVAMDEYFKLAQWEPEWIEESIRLTREMWENHYKPPPAPQATMSQRSNTCPKVIKWDMHCLSFSYSVKNYS
ncbi:hypothetical protein PGT21_022855 [Puccinia graminis f. sp. tritici]|uniref:hAT-like transposase RNase-H fold domain-containing protein n=1 Tax=Puccinia graminis f. sp. tritici TaxID=56615 RepID=A0A5B0PYA0_PUCGR|nr:hypothetical protein PGT21_022855 [Puccinia graminis f. sp. tritici]